MVAVNPSKSKHLPKSADCPHLLRGIDLPLPALMIQIPGSCVSGPHVPVYFPVIRPQLLGVLLIHFINHLGYARHHRAPCSYLNPVRFARCIIHSPDTAGCHLVNDLPYGLAVCPCAGSDPQHGLVQAALQILRQRREYLLPAHLYIKPCCLGDVFHRPQAVSGLFPDCFHDLLKPLVFFVGQIVPACGLIDSLVADIIRLCSLIVDLVDIKPC